MTQDADLEKVARFEAALNLLIERITADPVVSIDQKTVGSNPRSTVGTMTDISDYLRMCSPRWGRRTVRCAKSRSRFALPTR
jgi:excinuclease UvrABC ATPase subunit